MTEVFISYANEDKEIAAKLHSDLKKLGIDTWLDKENLIPGENWRVSIEKAIKKTKYFIALLSNNSINKRGYVQKELNIALEILGEIPENDVFIIPVRIEKCPISHSKLSNIHRIDLFPSYEEGLKNILRAIEGESIIGQWVDPADNDTVFFKKIGKKIVGFYNFDGRNKIAGVYIGKLTGRSFEYSWKWLDDDDEGEGHGRMMLSIDSKRLSGEWWCSDDIDDIEHLGYIRVSDDMPSWLNDSDFENFSLTSSNNSE